MVVKGCICVLNPINLRRTDEINGIQYLTIFLVRIVPYDDICTNSRTYYIKISYLFRVIVSNTYYIL